MIRPATSADAEAIAAIYAPIVRETAISFEEEAPSAPEIAARMSALLPALPYRVAERAGDVVGYAYASPHRQRSAYRFAVDVTVYVSETAPPERCRPRALPTAPAQSARQRIASRLCGDRVAEHGQHCAARSTRFPAYRNHHEVGFKFGRWHDVGWWERDLTGE